MLEQHENSEIYCLWVVGGRMIAFPFFFLCVCVPFSISQMFYNRHDMHLLQP